MKLRVELVTNKCIGNRFCGNIDPRRFIVKEGTAELIDGEKAENIWKINVDSDDVDFKQITAAAKACPVNAIKVVDTENNKDIVDTEVKQNDVKVIKASYDDLKEFVMDPKGYFLIDVNRENNEIMIGFCGELNIVSMKITGKKPLEIYQTVIKEKLISRLDHAAYLGRETQKAFIALQEGIVYIQDDELDFSKKI